MAKIFILFLLLLIHISSYAQNLISGTVSDKETKEVLIGANVVVKNTATGTATDLDGSFQKGVHTNHRDVADLFNSCRYRCRILGEPRNV